MEADRLYHDPDLVRFYDLENRWSGDFEFCAVLAKDASSVLDLGCGTGQLAAALANDGRRTVAGVDPAPAMLDIARARAGGTSVRWIEGDARTVRLRQRFDLVVLTGHVFQVFLSSADQLAVLCTIAAHLAPEGRFILDTRNPLAATWKRWTPMLSRRQIIDPDLGIVNAWHDAVHDPETDIVTYETHYDTVGGRHLSTCSKIAFPSRDHLRELLERARLAVECWYGDWRGAPYSPASPEIIPVGKLR